MENDKQLEKIQQTLEAILAELKKLSVKGSESMFVADSGFGTDSFYEQAKEVVIEWRIATPSFLQRRLRVGYARAARLIDLLEEGGVIGSSDGTNPRNVLIDPKKRLKMIDIAGNSKTEGQFSACAKDGDDPLYEQAKSLVIQFGKASASFLQRRLRTGYARSARLIDLLEERGVIEAGDGAKPRKVLINRGK